MAWTSSITMPSMVGIVGRAPAAAVGLHVDEKVRCFCRQAYAQRSMSAGTGPKMFFRPAWATHCSVEGEI